MELIYEISVNGRRGVRLPASDVPAATPLPGELLRAEPAGLPELSELDVVRHFTQLSRRNIGVDTTFYPLGSCTMKYNPKAMEEAARLFLPFHPMIALLPGGEALAQGTLADASTTWESCSKRSPGWMRSRVNRWPGRTAR